MVDFYDAPSLDSDLTDEEYRLFFTEAEELTEEQLEALRQAGFVVWTPTGDPYTDDLTAGKLNTAARKVLRTAPEESSLRLRCDAVTLEALPMLYSYLEAQNFTVAPINEWTTPY